MFRSRVPGATFGRVISGLMVCLVMACGNEGTTDPPDQNPAPSLTTASPDEVTVGQNGFTLTVGGADFVASSVVRWNGSDRSTTYVDEGTLRAAIPASDVTVAGTASISVFTPPPGGGVSASLTVSVVNLAPSLTALSARAVLAGEGAFTLTVEGATFAESSVVRWNGANRTTTYVDPGTLQAEILASDVATSGTASIAVFTPSPGGGVSGSLPFAILSPPTGQIVFVSERDGNAEIYLMNADGTGQVNVTNNAASDKNPAWSPDGSQIAFVSDRDGDREVYVMNADGSDPVNLTNNPADDWRTGAINDWAPAWSPDGSKILFATDRDGNDEIYVMNADGSGQTNLTNRPDSDWRPGWSPDGSQIVWVTQPSSGTWEIYVMNPDGTGQVNLTNTSGALDYAPAWSPDGSRIAFDTSRDAPQGLLGEIYLMNANGSDPVNLTNSTTDDLKATWSPDGSRIAFISRDGEWMLKSIAVDGTNELNLGRAEPSSLPAWSADGSWLVLSSAGDVLVTDSDGLLQLNLTDAAGQDLHPRWRPGL